MPISVYDAVAKFSADTTQLDQFTVKLERGLTSASEKAAAATVAHSQALAEFRAAIKAASSATDDGSASIQRLAEAEKQLQVTAAAASQSQRQLKTDLGITTQSTREARGEAMLLGEAFGVHLPREVNTFLAKLPGVGQALNAAFAATAVFFLADALVGGAEKLSKYIADTFIFTQAMKESDAAIADMNKKLLASADAYNKAEEGLRKFGASGTDAIKLQIADNEKAIAQAKEQQQQSVANAGTAQQTLNKYIEQAGWLSRMYDSVKSIVLKQDDQAEVLNNNVGLQQNAVNIAAAQARALEEQNKLLQEQLETQSKLDAIDQGKSVRSASLNLQKQRALGVVAFEQDVAAQRAVIEQQFEAKTYLLERNSLEQKLAILKEHDENTKDQQAKVNNELLALQENYDAKVVASANKLKDELATIEKAIINTSSTGPRQSFAASILGDYQDDFAKAEQAAADLGVTLGGTLTQNIDKAKAAYQQLVALEKEGKITALDLKNAHIQEIEAEIAYAKATGVSAQQIQNLVNLENKLKGETDSTAEKFKRAQISFRDFFAQLTSGSIKAGAALRDFRDLTIDAIGQSVTAAVSGSQTFGQAMEQMLKSALAELAGEATVKALKEFAEGYSAAANPLTAALAPGYFHAGAEWLAVAAAAGIGGAALSSGGKSGASSSGSSSSPITTSPAGNSAPQPVQTINVLRAGAGALISQPTLMLVGDSRSSANIGAREAVIPLDDPEAKRQIAGSMGGTGDVHIHVGVIAGNSDQVGRTIAQHVNRVVKKGTAKLHSTSTGRLIKKSP